MPQTITPALLQDINTLYQTIFNGAMEGVESSWRKIAIPVPSTSKKNVYPWLATTPGIREWIGERFIHSLEKDAFELVNQKWEETISVDRDDIEDDQAGLYGPAVAILGEDAAQHPDDMVWPLLPGGFTSLCFDGQFFFDTDHPVKDKNGVEQSVSNHMGGAGTAWYLLDTTKTRKPFIYQTRTEAQFDALNNPTDPNVFMQDKFLWGLRMRNTAGYAFWQTAMASKQTLDTANFNAAYAAMLELRGEYGKKLNIKPNLLVVPASLRDAANEVVVSERLANGATNTNRNVVEVHVEGRLAA